MGQLAETHNPEEQLELLISDLKDLVDYFHDEILLQLDGKNVSSNLKGYYKNILLGMLEVGIASKSDVGVIHRKITDDLKEGDEVSESMDAIKKNINGVIMKFYEDFKNSKLVDNKVDGFRLFLMGLKGLGVSEDKLDNIKSRIRAITGRDDIYKVI